MAEQRPNKKVVKVESHAAPTRSGDADTDGPVWTPSPEAKAKATRNRIIAIVLWALAIAGEAFAIFWVLRQDPVIMWLLIVMIVVIGLLAVGGSLLWKAANRLDPASRKDTVRFFVQNQLGAIISIVAFLPLIVLIFTNKNMTQGQKALAGIIGIVIAAGATAASAQWGEAPSQEQYANESSLVQDITGKDEVYWTKAGTVFHLCQEASAVNKESKDNQILTGTVQAAHEAGKPRLTLQLPQELRECGYDDYVLPDNWKDVVEGKAPFQGAGNSDTDTTDAPVEEPTPASTN
ncbi:hypothetical protein [Microbacterium gorillae]|uniref:hypothetical protein n=1 Tax=Microbacterium gorillae TaxID=1231063 RepID=UPI000693EFF4|nr:hypothetical protein [Microbacterium gorillae]